MDLKKQQFVKTIDQNKGTISSLCRVYYPHPEDQRDAFQDIVLQLWKSLETFRGESEISTWIYRVSLNTLLSKKRKEKKAVATEPMTSADRLWSAASVDDDAELLQLVLQALKDLDKAIVILYLEGYKNKEIARILHLSPSNVSTRLNRVKAALKAKFKTQQHALR